MQVGVIMGGDSMEREISFMTGNEVIKNLDKTKYEVVPIPINTRFQLIDQIRDLSFAFIALHGEFGEDGKIQAMLETMHVPYTGCGIFASALCMNKIMSKIIFKNCAIETPGWIHIKLDVYNSYEDKNLFMKDFNLDKKFFPLVVKPNKGGSSIGIFVVNTKEELLNSIDLSFKFDKDVIIEDFIHGEEITVSVLNGEVLPIIGIKPEASFFNYESKYSKNGVEEKIISLPKTLHNKVKTIAETIWKEFSLQVYARIDMIISGGEIYVLEINTLSGMTENSLIPKSAKAYGIPFNELLDKIIEYSLMIDRY
ncbi:D-alanine--D-alanine ligase [Clostridium grantii]|uniref:D-alanine--D-alanine ligase n=1 Tax=Clostridium grantii DSM 8605 TaxID=1121316 RepID=A0A1M5XZ95_9CLOT|nr:D-alanine--D-alanine ligase [Clostridium grantii]SHI05009.1 D-alanine--D-alanine ligase [Clostridium grantii DSM 8605]